MTGQHSGSWRWETGHSAPWPGSGGQRPPDRPARRAGGGTAAPAYAHQVTTSYAYDALNRRTQTLAAYGTSAQSTATVLYDAVGNVVSQTSGYSSTGSYSHTTTNSYGYDALYRHAAKLDGYGSSVQRPHTTDTD